jgi:hypothetical protein
MDVLSNSTHSSLPDAVYDPDAFNKEVGYKKHFWFNKPSHNLLIQNKPVEYGLTASPPIIHSEGEYEEEIGWKMRINKFILHNVVPILFIVWTITIIVVLLI